MHPRRFPRGPISPSKSALPSRHQSGEGARQPCRGVGRGWQVIRLNSGTPGARIVSRNTGTSITVSAYVKRPITQSLRLISPAHGDHPTACRHDRVTGVLISCPHIRGFPSHTTPPTCALLSSVGAPIIPSPVRASLVAFHGRMSTPLSAVEFGARTGDSTKLE